MHFPTILTLSLSLFTTAITAIAFPSTVSSGDCADCSSLVASTSSCNYDMLDSNDAEPTAAQYECMCKVDNFKKQYKTCVSCLVALGTMTSDDEDAANKDIDLQCAAVTGGAGCLAVGPGKIVAAGAMAVGLGMYAL
ncbi:hypothetical protein DFP73DRAFT_204931 [Morchella snyderi]|nr:hypothetical protein DFP73DRAFT_204931 [Morchella snyderi]